MEIIDTSFRVEYDMIDVLAASDATATTNHNKSFATIAKLSSGTQFSDSGTLEHNFFILDGSKNEFQDDPEVAFFSNEKSNSDGLFTNNPSITIQFSKPHSSVGFTIDFIEDYPLECIIYWYDINNVKLFNKTFKIDNLKATFFYPMVNYGKIVVEFTKAMPYRYIKINKLEYGIKFIWDEDKITNGSLLEEINPISNLIPVNTLTFSIIDELGDFNLGNPDGLHNYIQNGQYIKPYEYVRGKELFLGNFYIQKFKSDDRLCTFNCVNMIGLLDDSVFYKGDIYNGVKAGNIIDSIMETAGITDYEVDEETKNTLVYGSLKPMNCRQALREVLFFCQSLIDNSRSGKISIYKPTNKIMGEIPRERKVYTTVNKKSYVSGVKIQFNEYIKNEESKTIATGTYKKGNNLVIFNSPYDDITVKNGTLVEYGKYYCVFSLDEDGSNEIYGKSFEPKNKSVIVSNTFIPTGEKENVKSFTSLLANNITSESLANKILEYFKMQMEIKTQYLAIDEAVSQWKLIQNNNPNYNDYFAELESISTDLTGGFVSTAKLTGYYTELNKYYYLGTDIIADNNIII